jgi:hypothetical protein
MARRRTLVLAALAAWLVAGSAERGDPAARLSAADGALEYWDFVARFDGGQRLVARVLVTNEGPGKRTAVGVGHLVLPDGEVVEFRNGRLEGRWSIAEDRRSLRIGSTQLDLGGPVRTLEYDSDRRGIEIRLRFHTASPARYPSSGERAGYRVDLLDLAAPVDGTFLLPGMSAALPIAGRAAISHTWMDESEPRLVQRRIDFASLEPGDAFYLRDVLDPEGKSHRWLLVAHDASVLLESSDFSVALEDAGGAAERDYPVPARLRISAPGLAGTVTLGRRLVSHDPLGDLPQPFRFLLSFAMRPRRVWTDSPFSLRVGAAPGRAPIELDGDGITSVTYLNPLPAPTSGSSNRTPGSPVTLE